MKWVWRAVFATILIATAGIDLYSADRQAGEKYRESVVIRLAESRGLLYRQTRSLSNGLLTSIVFEAAGCSRPIQVVPLNLTLETAPLLHLVDEPGDIRRFVYIERDSPEKEGFRVFLEYAKHTALGMVGLSPYFAYPTLVMATEPPDCRAVESVDWRLIWSRDYTAASG